MFNQLKANKYFLISLFLFSFLVRSLVFHFYLSKDENYWQVDSNTYHVIAENIAAGNGISADGQSPEFYRLPGYSLFLSSYYKLFGTDKKNVLWLQVFFASFIPILIFLLSLVLFPAGILLAKVASFYSAIHLGLVLYSGYFMTESLFLIFFLLFSILFFSSFNLFFCKKYQEFEPIWCPGPFCSGPGFVELSEKLEEQQRSKLNFYLYKKLFFAGIFLGIASLIRPVGHYLIVLSIVALLFSQNSFFSKIKKSLILFLGWLLIVIGWLLRNYILLGQVFFHTLPGGHFLYFSAARVAMHTQSCSYWQAKQNLSDEVEELRKSQEKTLGRGLNEIELCNLRGDVAVKYFKQYPLITLKNWLTDIMRTGLSLYSAELVLLDNNKIPIDYFAKERTVKSMFARFLFPQTKSKFLRAIIYLEILTFFLILLGFCLSFLFSIVDFFRYDWTFVQKRALCTFIKVLPFMALFIVIGLSGGFNRMRLPVEPFLIVFAFSFWIYFFKLLYVKNEN